MGASPIWQVTDSFFLILDAPPVLPTTYPGALLMMFMQLQGTCSVAILTACFADATELGSSEAWFTHRMYARNQARYGRV